VGAKHYCVTLRYCGRRCTDLFGACSFRATSVARKAAPPRTNRHLDALSARPCDEVVLVASMRSRAGPRETSTTGHGSARATGTGASDIALVAPPIAGLRCAPPGSVNGAHYPDGYERTAALLDFVGQKYATPIARQINAPLHAGNAGAVASAFQTATGRGLAQQWSDCRASTCAGGRP
jgi:hypothetical protein